MIKTIILVQIRTNDTMTDPTGCCGKLSKNIIASIKVLFTKKVIELDKLKDSGNFCDFY